MPFGPNCEYADFTACVRANSDKDDPDGYCAELMRRTEDACKNASDMVRPPRLLNPRDMVNLHRDARGWYRIRNATGARDAPAEVYLYGYIGWDVGAVEFVKELAAVTADQIDVHIATNGGDVFEGVLILNALRSHAAQITTIVDSQALSAGSFIMQAGKTRKMMPNTTVMIHDALTMGAYAEGNAQDMREFAKEIEKFADVLEMTSDNIASIYAQRAGGEVADWRKIMKAETWYSAQDAVDAGLADEVVPDASNGVRRQVQTVVPQPDPSAQYDYSELARALREGTQCP